MRKSKPTLEDKLLEDCYNQLLKETGDVPTVEEVQKRYLEKYGNSH